MGAQYVTAALKVTIVGWLLCEMVSWSPVGWFTQVVLYDYCYALCLSWVSLGHVGPVGLYLMGWSSWYLEVCFASARCVSISVGRVLFPCVLEIMLSGPRLLLSALALGMCMLGLLL